MTRRDRLPRWGGVKEAAQWIETGHHPAWVICITVDSDPAAAGSLVREKGLTTVLTAVDPANSLKISLKNTQQFKLINAKGELEMADWRNKPTDMLSSAEGKTPGHCALQVDGLIDEKLIAAWWAAERGRPGALKDIAAAAKQKGPLHDQAQKVIDAVTPALADAVAKAGDGFTAYEALERAAKRYDGLDLKALKDRLAELGKNAQVKKELKARSVWRECQNLLSSSKPKDQTLGKDSLAQLAKTMPDTVYGKRAAEGK